MYGFWGFVLLVGMVNRFFAFIVQRTAERATGNTEAISERKVQSSKSSFATVKRLVRQHITLPAVLGYRHSVPWGWCTVPTRIQTFIVFAFVGINIVLCSVHYKSVDRST